MQTKKVGEKSRNKKLELKILKSLRTQKSNFTLLRKISQIHLTFLLIFLAESGPFYPLQMFGKFAEHLNRTSNLSEHPFFSQNRTSNHPNITKNWTVREHRTVCSKTKFRPWSSNVMYGWNSFGSANNMKIEVSGRLSWKVVKLLLRKVKKVDLFWPWKEVSQVSENFLQKLLLLQNNLHLYSECKRFEKNLGLACLENLRLQWRYIYLLGKK